MAEGISGKIRGCLPRIKMPGVQLNMKVGGRAMKKTIVIMLLLLLWSGFASADAKRFQVPLEGSPSIGPANAPVTIVEFIDYQ